MEDHQCIKSNPPLGMLQPNHWNIKELNIMLHSGRLHDSKIRNTYAVRSNGAMANHAIAIIDFIADILHNIWLEL